MKRMISVGHGINGALCLATEREGGREEPPPRFYKVRKKEDVCLSGDGNGILINKIHR